MGFKQVGVVPCGLWQLLGILLKDEDLEKLPVIITLTPLLPACLFRIYSLGHSLACSVLQRMK